ncbi:AraC family transcriptional regulator [Aureisphaera galaxeae]|uniref:AraC family transcriptional regulator n=1 Tax=Aureisphaera galaxeae TaxID=1538023 RepID=UPI002350511A|nr:AraC family transcriptional regulator [Aureisphaera galaxeae]MDC8002866.1 AraC family transcriptional regulator [Aureisphaera galaxeae]
MKTFIPKPSKLYRYRCLAVVGFLFFWSSKQLYGQSDTQVPTSEEEKRNLMLKGSADGAKMFLFKRLSDTSTSFSNYNQLYLQRGKTSKNDTIIYNAHYLSGLYYHHTKSEFHIATQYADSALVAAHNIGDPKKISRTRILRGNSEFEQGNYESALSSYLQALKTARESNLKEEEIYSLQAIGHVRKELKQFKEGIDIYHQVLTLLKSEGYQQIDAYKGSYINALNVLGICHRELGDTEKAIQYYKEGLHKIAEFGMENAFRDRAMLLSGMGKAYSDQGDYDIALDHHEVAKEIFQNENITKSHIYFHIHLFMAEALKGQKNYDQALSTLGNAVSHAEENVYSDVFIEICDLAVDLARRLNDNQEVLKYSSLRIKITDSIHKENVLTRDLINEDLTETNEQLITDNETKSARLKRTRIFIFILLASLLGSFSFYRYNLSRNRKKFRLLMEKMQDEKKEPTAPNSIISDEKAHKILMQLQKLEERQFFLKTDCSLHKTATKLKTNTSYLSKIINSYKQKTFKEYINELRIAFVMDQVKENPRFRMYTIKAIAEETGYKSVNTLNSAFKKHTQLSLSYYIKQCSKEP